MGSRVRIGGRSGKGTEGSGEGNGRFSGSGRKKEWREGFGGGEGGGGAITGNRSYQLIAIPNIMTGRDQENNGQNTA